MDSCVLVGHKLAACDIDKLVHQNAASQGGSSCEVLPWCGTCNSPLGLKSAAVFMENLQALTG